MKKKNKTDKQRKLAQKRARQYLQTLDAGKIKIPLEIKNYKNLGYTLKSITKVLQTTLITEIEKPELIEHDKWDIYNLLELIKIIIPKSELEFLDNLEKP